MKINGSDKLIYISRSSCCDCVAGLAKPCPRIFIYIGLYFFSVSFSAFDLHNTEFSFGLSDTTIIIDFGIYFSLPLGSSRSTVHFNLVLIHQMKMIGMIGKKFLYSLWILWYVKICIVIISNLICAPILVSSNCSVRLLRLAFCNW